MKDEDIIGREIVCFKFDNDDRLTYTDTYKKLEGLTGTVLNLHANYPEYANVEVNILGKTEKWHYPTELIKKQLKELDEVIDLDDILLQIRNLIP
jgi:hypothetical protein